MRRSSRAQEKSCAGKAGEGEGMMNKRRDREKGRVDTLEMYDPK